MLWWKTQIAKNLWLVAGLLGRIPASAQMLPGQFIEVHVGSWTFI